MKGRVFGTLSNGTEAQLFTIQNVNNMQMSVTNYGAILTSLKIPCKGKLLEVTLGFHSLEEYLSEAYKKQNPCFGAIVGRYANRVAKAKLPVEGVVYELTRNFGEDQLHGGFKGFSNVLWNVEEVVDGEEAKITLSYKSQHLEEGFPGNVDVVVSYILTVNNELRIEYKGITDKPTHLNLTQHSYFNFNEDKSPITNHFLQVNATHYLEADKRNVPTGKFLPIENSVVDFLNSKTIGEQLKIQPNGFDHAMVLKKTSTEPEFAARVIEKNSGLAMEVYTTEPSVHIFTANHFDGTLVNKNGIVFGKHAGLCIEAQHFPDSPNKPNFPSTLLLPNEIYSQITVHKFFEI